MTRKFELIKTEKILNDTSESIRYDINMTVTYLEGYSRSEYLSGLSKEDLNNLRNLLTPKENNK